ncbi:MAG: 1-deoxy-D-xylulose-5-phosphate reductoisomerase [Clostridia bacterium]|nr:1-deoxy-D-xylulose-5-phosphate reductoisomerase [Clostridia bacterium]
MISIALIGSTGSIGRQVCAVVRRYPEKFRFSALVANKNAKILAEQVDFFKPDRAVLLDESALLNMPTPPEGVALRSGEQSALDAVCDCDVVFVAATGFAGLKYSLKAIECKKRLALANKETLVCGGELVMRLVEEKKVDLVPVDSEHSAIFQALHFNRNAKFSSLILTASGGPFYGYTKEQLQGVTVQKALKHPTWSMGAKITIDSATLLNKGFEVIEAKWLYHAPFEKIQTVVQPESIIHSMVSFSDGSVLAQMSYPTMEVPIQLALTYPERLPCNLKPLDFSALGAIHFKPLKRKDFPCYDLALTAGEWGDNYPCALNAAGEVAVNAFLKEEIGFTNIAEVIEETLSRTAREKVSDYVTLCGVDRRAREEAKKIIKNVK